MFSAVSRPFSLMSESIAENLNSAWLVTLAEKVETEGPLTGIRS
jgi:hypothetical protein